MLVGLVKKNGIMMVDFASRRAARARQDAARGDPRGVPGALPADHDDDDGGAGRHAADRARLGAGAESRRPLGLAVVGGLLVSQLLTLYITPVFYIYIGRRARGPGLRIEARREGLQALIVEKGSLVNSIVGYPARMEFFSTPDLIEIGGYPFPIQGYKPTREEAVEYYRGVAGQEKLDIRLYERVLSVDGNAGDFTITTDRSEYHARHVIVSIGFFDKPNYLDVPGEDLPNVTHYYREPYQYVRQKVAVIGARNSAAKAALDCYRHGAAVTLIVRSAKLSDKIKYWIRPDLENRIKEGSIRAHFNTTVEAIRPSSLRLKTPKDSIEIENDWVIAMTGYRPDYSFLEALNLEIRDDPYRTPVYDETTFETSRPGIYLAGTVCGGLRTGRWFIENGRFHARQIARHMAHRATEPIRFDKIHWKTEE
jgi:thioredoxin reductase (NADPH)